MSKLNTLLRRYLAAESPAPALATPADPVDLATIRSLDRGVVHLVHPVSGERLGATVTLAAPDHHARRQVKLDLARAQRDRQEPEADEALALADAAAVEFLSRIILDWSGIKVDGIAVPFSAAAARDLLTPEPMRWLVNQLLHESARDENFIETSAPS